jgi:RNA polymerase sigma-70 factor, ECF subfamily
MGRPHGAEDMSGAGSSTEPPQGGNPDRVSTFVALYTSHYPRLQFYIMALLPTANEAADVLQDTSLVLWQKFDTFEPGSNFFAWACKIARYQVLQHRERQGRTARIFDVQLLERIADEACDEDLVPAIPLQALEECLGRLPEGDRSLIRRRYEPGMTVQRLSQDIGRTANSLSKSLSRIRRALLECVDRVVSRETRM